MPVGGLAGGTVAPWALGEGGGVPVCSLGGCVNGADVVMRGGVCGLLDGGAPVGAGMLGIAEWVLGTGGRGGNALACALGGCMADAGVNVGAVATGAVGCVIGVLWRSGGGLAVCAGGAGVAVAGVTGLGRAGMAEVGRGAAGAGGAADSPRSKMTSVRTGRSSPVPSLLGSAPCWRSRALASFIRVLATSSSAVPSGEVGRMGGVIGLSCVRHRTP